MAWQIALPHWEKLIRRCTLVREPSHRSSDAGSAAVGNTPSDKPSTGFR